VRDGF